MPALVENANPHSPPNQNDGFHGFGGHTYPRHEHNHFSRGVSWRQ
jgi:hypothetical protein